MEIENLKAYLATIHMSLRDFCKLIDCNYTYLSRVINGNHIVSRRLAKDVSNATGGIIKLNTRPRKKDPKQKENQNENQHSSAA